MNEFFLKDYRKRLILARNLYCGNGPIASSYRDFNATSKNATWIYLVISNSGACLYRYCYTLFYMVLTKVSY